MPRPRLQKQLRVFRSDNRHNRGPARRLEVELLEDRLVPAIAGTANQNFVAQAYLDQFGMQRQVDPAGLASWSGMLDQGASRLQVVLGIQNSPEFKIDEVTQAYLTILRRSPDVAGLNAFVGFLEAGGRIEQVEAIMYGSPEYFQLKGGTNDDFLTGVFIAIQGNPTVNTKNQKIDAVDPDGRGVRADWDLLLANGVSRTEVAMLLAENPNAQDRDGLRGLKKRINGLYESILKRDADPVGLNAFVNLAALLGIDGISAIMTASDERAEEIKEKPPTVPGINMTNLSVTVAPSGPVSLNTPLRITAAIAKPSDGPYSVSGQLVAFFDQTGHLLGHPATLGADGKASIITAELGAGSQRVTAKYNGDPNFTATSGSTIVQVGQGATTLDLSPLDKVSGFSDGVDVTATLKSASGPLIPGGMVTFEEQAANGSTTTLKQLLISGTPVTQNGQLILTVSDTLKGLATGQHELVAIYGGDRNFAGSTSNNVGRTVVPDSAQSPVVTINSSLGGTATNTSSSPFDAKLGQSVTFTASAAPPPGVNFPLTGTLTLELFVHGTATNGVPLGTVDLLQNPGATVVSPVQTLPAGQYDIMATYMPSTLESNVGHPIYKTGNATLLQTVIGQGTMLTSLTPDKPNPVLGDQVTFTAVIDAQDIASFKPTDADTSGNGMMHFVLALQPGNVPLTSQDMPLTFTGGHYQAQFRTGALGANDSNDSYSIAASYNGNGNYQASKPLSIQFSVAKQDTTVAAQLNNGFTPNVPFSFSVTAKKQLPIGAPAPTGNVTVTISTQPQQTVEKVNLNSTATFSQLFPLFDMNNNLVDYSVTVQYLGDSNYNASVQQYTLHFMEDSPPDDDITTEEHSRDPNKPNMFDDPQDQYTLLQ